MNARRSLILVTFGTFALGAQAQQVTEIYKCTDATGRPLYTSDKKDTAGKKCELVSREINVVAPQKPAAARTPSSGDAAAGKKAAAACAGCHGEQGVSSNPANPSLAGQDSEYFAAMAANDPVIDAYKAAVSAMKALPAGDRRNWERQATIHFDFCPHGNWWFLPWHRVYLFYFERICRKLSGYDEFALPYWNWTTHPSIPAAFWGAGNPLFEPRTATPAAGRGSSPGGWMSAAPGAPSSTTSRRSGRPTARSRSASTASR